MATIVQTVRKSDVNGDTGKDVTGWKLVVQFDATDRGADRIINALTKQGLGDLIRITEDGAEPTGARTSNDCTEVREWARANGYTVGNRGRINADILNAYGLANNGN